MKYCKKCKTTKPFEDFNKAKAAKDGCQGKCRDCETQYRRDNKEKIAARVKKQRAEHPEIFTERYRRYKVGREDILAAKSRKWQKDNRLKENARMAKRYAENESVREYAKKWRKDNAEKMRKWHREHAKEKRATDPQFAIRSRVTTRIREALVKSQKSASSVKLLGCSIAEYKAYIESLFTEGMDWEALLRGEIHLDHKIPCCAFDLTKPEEQHKCFYYTNTQPLWAEDNHKKVGADLKMKKERLGDKAIGNGVSSDNTNL